MLVLAAAVLAIIIAIVPVVVFARRRPDYSHVRQTISELGERGARDEKTVAMFAFAPAGHTVWLFVAALAFAEPRLADGAGLWLFALLGAGYIGAAIFPCDPGGKLIGSARNNLHNVIALLGYAGAAGGMIALARPMEDIEALRSIADISRVAGQVAFAGIVLLCIPSPVRGLVQRIVETIIYGWMLLVAVVLLA